MYEGLHKVCFSCGRVGHQKEDCPNTIRHHLQPTTDSSESPPNLMMSGQRDHEVVHHDSGNIPLLNIQEDIKDGSYGPWMVVTWKRNLQKTPRMQHIQYDVKCPHQAYARHTPPIMGERVAKESKRKFSVDLKTLGPKLSSSLGSIIKRYFDSYSLMIDVGPNTTETSTNNSIKGRKRKS